MVYRVARECLTNAARHAPGAHVTITLDARQEQLVLRVRDDGPRMDTTRASDGAGIRFMRERALMVAASLQFTSGHGAGTAVTLTVPLNGEPCG